MPLTQAEADRLLALAKEFVESDPLIYPYTQPLSYDRALRSIDRREEFFLTVERGNRKRARLKYQTRGRGVIVLARVEFNGRAHRNPPDSPYRPGERMECPHIHIYREGFDDRIAYDVADVPALTLRDPGNGSYCLEDFLRFCNIQKWPQIQFGI
jgi:hypothetical protein